jgi:Domain of unknown function (DUF3783)
MTDATFQKVGLSEKCFYGPRKLLLCGFSSAGQPKFKALLGMLTIDDLPLIWCGTAEGPETVGRLMQRPDGCGEGVDSNLPRAIIVAGINENELHRLMSACKQSGMQQALWAVLTTASETWPLDRLLNELDSERRSLNR